MFTGIVTDLGEVLDLEPQGEGLRVRLRTSLDLGDAPSGASIACAGVCLTITARRRDGAGWSFDADVSKETLDKTTLGLWRPGRRVNLERPLRLGDEFGGHVVSGHVDGVGEVVSVAPQRDSSRLRFRAPKGLARFIAEKGSVAVDGASLTVNAVEGAEFEVNLIPHTLAVTSFGELTPGLPVNLEIDLLARYVARLKDAAVEGV
ncbi:riboflavin synthase [Neomegalonema sp.]|uniref:riboflavin synthase n=1 Tax=Neomegalonema sp. TaxID=2039713 RepID=UPI002632A592|nr:riboflavin synthase [Neomegalonema sp.]MDD2867217.1 riboflavin synthase [Neomegalonema sp.]